MSTSWRDGLRQAGIIARATFDGFLQADLMPSGMQAPAFIWAAAFFVGPSFFLPVQYLAKYPFLRRFYPDRVEGAFWSDRLLFLVLSAGAVGLVAVVLWETLFPARRDAFVLTPLPVWPIVQVTGRLLGLGAVFVAFALLLNVVPTILYPGVAAATLTGGLRMMAGHLIATTAADAFVFFSITALEGTVILFVGRRVSSAMAAGVQATAVLVLLLSLLFLDPVRSLTVDALAGGHPYDRVLAWFPPAWFLGLYEFIAGSPRAVMRALAARAALAAILPVTATIAIHVLGYRRLLARAVETRERSTRSVLGNISASVLRAIAIRRPPEQAIASFIVRTISRSGRHRMLASVSLGASAAIIATAILPDLVRHGPAVFAHPGVSTLSAPLVLAVALGVGLRLLMTIPADMPPRWIFEALPLSAPRIDRAVHQTVVLLVVWPVVALAGLSALTLWGAAIAWKHALFCGALALLLCEVLLVRFQGLPFTRAYVPGGARVHMLWPLYVALFVIYTYTAAGVEQDLLATGGIGYAVAWLGGIAAAVWIRRAWKRRGVTAVSFAADMPDEMFGGFNLSEGLAAEAVHRTTDHEPPLGVRGANAP